MIDDDLKNQLELALEETTQPAANNVKAFTPRRKTKEPEGITHDELMSEGLHFFAEQLSNNAKGFFAVVFDKDFQPQIVWTGEIELIPALGALELAKNEILNNIFTDIE